MRSSRRWAAITLVIGVAGAVRPAPRAQAQSPPGTEPVIRVAGDLSPYYPERALRIQIAGAARISCEVTAAGTLADCLAVGEEPAGFGFAAAALRAAAGVGTTAPAPGAPQREVFPVVFEVDGGRWPDPWSEQPSDADLDAARAPGAPPYGMATLNCATTAQGAVADCRVSSESPAGQGFGAAALRVAPRYHLREGAVTPQVEVTITADAPPRASASVTAVQPPRAVLAQWEAEPAAADVAAATPASRLRSAYIEFICQLGRDGRLGDCRASWPPKPRPEQIASVLALASGYRLSAASTQAAFRIEFNVNWPTLSGYASRARPAAATGGAARGP